MLRVRNIVRSYQGVPILKDISFEITKGSVVGLMGASGSGKSTLLRCIQRLDRPDSGSIECQGRVGMMLQDFQLFPHMTVIDNITYVPRHVLKIDRAIVDHHAHELLYALGLNLKKEHKPHQLSGGQKQRAALARALAAQPDLLLCDEPTSALDACTIQDLCDIFQKVTAMGVTMLMASHDKAFLTQITHRLLILNHGVLAGDFKAKHGQYMPEDLDEATKILGMRT